MDALEVFASSNVTTVLIDSLGRLLQMGQSMQLTVASIDHINAVTNGMMLSLTPSHHGLD